MNDQEILTKILHRLETEPLELSVYETGEVDYVISKEGTEYVYRRYYPGGFMREMQTQTGEGHDPSLLNLFSKILCFSWWTV